MNQLTLSIAIVLLVFVSQSALARKWTDLSGTTSVEAEFVELVDGNAVLRKSDGKTIRVPLTKLSVADQAHVRQLSNPMQDEPAGESLRSLDAQYRELLVAHREAVARLTTQQTQLEDAGKQIDTLRQELKAATSISIKDETVRACEEALHIAPLIVRLEGGIEELNAQSQRVAARQEEKRKAGEPTDAEERELALLEPILMTQKEELEKLVSKVPKDPAILSMYNHHRKMAIARDFQLDELVRKMSQLGLENRRLKEAQGILPEPRAPEFPFEATPRVRPEDDSNALKLSSSRDDWLAASPAGREAICLEFIQRTHPFDPISIKKVLTKRYLVAMDEYFKTNETSETLDVAFKKMLNDSGLAWEKELRSQE